jgi:hypothetical protein
MRAVLPLVVVVLSVACASKTPTDWSPYGQVLGREEILEKGPLDLHDILHQLGWLRENPPVYENKTLMGGPDALRGFNLQIVDSVSWVPRYWADGMLPMLNPGISRADPVIIVWTRTRRRG